MTNAYDPREIEARWQRVWEEQRTFRTPNPGDPDFDPTRPKHYVLDMFPYPSGAGLHVGHPVGYIGTDVIARRKRMEGFNVLHPMGFDAFGLPAEQYAIQTGRPPAETTAANIATYRRQMRMLGLSYDWERELATSDPRFYRWTQWIFKRLFERGLAYRTEVPVWWCEELKTVLANEEVVNGRSERGDHPCERRPLRQWMLAITVYAERLLSDLDLVDWPESVKAQQRNWIGRSDGAEVEFPISGHDAALSIFTTRPDTLFGATFMVVAPEHEVVARFTTAERRAEVEAYVAAAAVKTDLERTDLAKDKSGVFTGAHCLNPVFAPADPRARVPIFAADYVLASYGTGAIMAVPAHDARDCRFAMTYGLAIRDVVQPHFAPMFLAGAKDGEKQQGHELAVVRNVGEKWCFIADGYAKNSGFLNGKDTPQAKAAMIAWLEQRGLGRSKTTYRLRDWLFSRQRYWGEPFPLLHRADGSVVAVPDEDLPVELPAMDDFTPSEDGSPPLARATEWLRAVDPETGAPARRETDTMPNWAGSCWYYLRFMDPANDAAIVSPEAERYWGSVDLYVGGVEHAVLHLLYARFWHKVLYDLGLVSTVEPFQRLFNQGMIQAFAYKDASGRLVPADEVDESVDPAVRRAGGPPLERIVAKMSKSLRNVVNPDQVVAEHGADTFRVYEMFMGPLSDSKPWNTRDVPGSRRFLDRVWRLIVDPEGKEPVRPHLAAPAAGEPAGGALVIERALNRALKRVDESFAGLNFNTAIAGLMEFLNTATKHADDLRRDQAERLVRALAPFAPHIGEELWHRLGHAGSVSTAAWPAVDARYLVEDEVEVAVQVGGKLRGRVTVARALEQAGVEAAARASVATHLAGKQVLKVVVVPNRLVNFVVR